MQQASNVPEERVEDVASAVAAKMRRMRVVGLPRNYEIFYEVHTGSNPALAKEFADLGGHPSQEKLDALSQKYFAQNSRHVIVEKAQDEVATRTTEILGLLGRERNSLEKLGVILEETSDGLQTRGPLPHDILRKIVGIMAAATETTLEQGRQITRAMEEKSAELEKTRATLEKYKKLADTDPLTRIWNRRAFDRRLAGIYDNPRSVMFHALILADIDGFKGFNDRYGHPVGDRILQMVAQLLRAQGGEECFVARTGGEEFAIIVEGLSEEATRQLAEDTRVTIEKTEFAIGPASQDFGPINISLGVCMATDASDADDLYVKSDQALYASKVDGRNRVTLYSKLPKGKFSKSWLIYRSD